VCKSSTNPFQQTFKLVLHTVSDVSQQLYDVERIEITPFHIETISTEHTIHQCGHNSAFLFSIDFDWIFEKIMISISMSIFVNEVYKFLITAQHYNSGSD